MWKFYTYYEQIEPSEHVDKLTAEEESERQAYLDEMEYEKWRDNQLCKKNV